MRVSFVEIAGLRTRYYHAGAGAPVVLIHGGGASADTWVRNIPALAARHAVYAPDLIGHGFADFADMAGKAPQAEQARHVIRFMDQMSLDGVTLIGHSFGGLIAALICLAQPERIAKLVLVASASVFHPAEEQEATLRGAYENQIKALSDTSIAAIRARNVGSNFAKDDPFEEIVLTQLTFFALPDRKRAFEQTIEGLIASAGDLQHRVVHRLEQIAAPTLIVAGQNDPRLKHEHALAGQRRMRHARVEVFAQCGHKPYAEKADRFNRLVLDFLDGR
jgi:pimeloyl-ACP methyl ester carboxylesterase